MTPYYEQDGITIYHGDCREMLPELIADVVITDPPYNVGLVYGEAVDDMRVDYSAWCRGWFAECRSVAPLVALTPGIANVALWCAIEPPAWIMAWNKPAAMGRAPLGFNNWEPVLLWGTLPKAATSDAFTAALVPDHGLRHHPCPKPLRWGRELVARLAADGALILDPFMGSGTTLLAAKLLGRRAIGIEIEERYCEIAAKRLAQGVLFGAEVAA